MSARVLMIEPASISPESSCRSVLNLDLRYEWQTWEGFRPGMVLGSRAS
jgi:hypothetical protein